MADEQRRGEPAALAQNYERLRAAVLGGQPDGFRLGHGLFAARGLVAWMQTVSSVDPPVSTVSESSGPPAGEVLSLPGADELVAVMAQMALAHAA